MRSTFSFLFLLVCATVMAQTEYITKGKVPMGIIVFDHENDKYLNISDLCDGFDSDSIPQNLIIPDKSIIKVFFPTITEANAANYKAVLDGKEKLTMDNYNFDYDYKGKKVAMPVSYSSSGGQSKSFALRYTPEFISSSYGEKVVELNWKIDIEAIDWAIFLDNRRDEVLYRIAYELKNLFKTSGEPRDYSDWVEKGYATELAPDGIPVNPVFPYGLNRISFVSSSENISLTRNGESIELIRDEELEVLYFKPEKSGNYFLVIEEPEKKYGAKREVYSFTIAYSFWKQGGYFMLVGLGLLALAFLFYRINAKRKLESTQLQKQLSDAELKAVRAQLNPHFLFNALNAIQNLVNQNDTERANDYIVKLSKLLRTVLAQSDEALHALEEEVNLSRLYLELENMRSPFNFNIEVDSAVDMNALVPTMMLQPYLENAVIHGIQKKGATEVTLTVSQENEQLLLKVSDNGKNKNTTFHEGTGMALGRGRLDIIKKQSGDSVKAGIKVRASSENGFIVEIRLPADL